MKLKLSAAALKKVSAHRWKDELDYCDRVHYHDCLRVMKCIDESLSIDDLASRLFTQAGWSTQVLSVLYKLNMLAKLKYLHLYPMEEYMHHIGQFIRSQHKILHIIAPADIQQISIGPIGDFLQTEKQKEYRVFHRRPGMPSPYTIEHSLYVHLIYGDKTLLNKLLSLPEWKFPFNDGGVIYDPGYLEFFHSLKYACLQQDDKARSELDQFFRIESLRRNAIQSDLSGLKPKMLLAIIEKNQSNFNRALSNYIAASKKMTFGEIPVQILFMEDALAYCRLALNRNMQPIESDYLPSELLSYVDCSSSPV